MALLANWYLRQADILDDRPDDGQTTGFGREGINLIGALPNIPKQAFNRIGAADGAMHDRRERIKGQQVRFILDQTANGFRIALLVFGECSRPSSKGRPLSSPASRSL